MVTLATGGCVSTSMNNAPQKTLDALHDAAARADGEAYFALFEPCAVFLGTDATERWTLEEFRAYAEPHFAKGQGWTYKPWDRSVRLSNDGRTAWFDERVTNAKYGECRGTGVLVRGSDGGWRIAQYNLTKPVPNELMDRLVELERGDRGK
ncbi:MAG: nuclear transport factor 2 family protein [Phycisphaerales bacterium]|nr:nuclear transport factor 2 family protein [Phycisphaerales bacterium]